MYSGQTQAKTVVYVVTQKGSIYAFDGTPPTTAGTPCTLLAGPVPLLPNSTYTAVNCSLIGGRACQTIAPVVGILGTPVISANTGGTTTTGTIYIVSEGQSGSDPSVSYYHWLWALDITNLSAAVTPIQIQPQGSACPADSSFSQKHIQRPALLLPGDGYLYVSFSMMDGNSSPYPNGMIFAYNTGNLSAAPLCLALSQGSTLQNGAGIWQGGAGPAYAPDGLGKSYVFFNTANGTFDLNQSKPDAGDSFIKMSNSGTALSIADYFTPIDQRYRSDKTCGTGSGDVDLGSGGPMIIPYDENSGYPYLAVSGDKEGYLWFLNLQGPGEYGNSSNDNSCLGMGANANVQAFATNGTHVIHTNPAFWETGAGTNYLYVGSQSDGSNDSSGQLMQYQICGTGTTPITSGVTGCSNSVTYATDGGVQVTFPNGTTPSISAASSTQNDAIVWAIWADGDIVPNTQTISFTLHNQNFTVNPSQYGRLYAFDALNMTKLYSSEDCVLNGTYVDRINPATKFSIPTVANGHVYVGTMGARCQDPNTGLSGLDDSNGCYNSGTSYIFGKLSSERASCPVN